MISDRIGRRPVLLFGVTSTIACELFFGFSQNFTWAILARLLWGMLNGNIGVVKTYISEVRTEMQSRMTHTHTEKNLVQDLGRGGVTVFS